jgi:hypothetical protein
MCPVFQLQQGWLPAVLSAMPPLLSPIAVDLVSAPRVQEKDEEVQQATVDLATDGEGPESALWICNCKTGPSGNVHILTM